MTELLEELEPMSAIGPIGLAQVLLVIGPSLTSLAAAPKEARYGKVWVGAIEEARGMAFRRVFVPGVNKGNGARLQSLQCVCRRWRRRIIRLVR